MTRSKATRRLRRRKADQDWPIIYPGKKPRLYLDSNIPADFVDALGQRRVDAIHPVDEAWTAHDDGFHWQKAKELRRTLVTCDVHFWDDTRFPLHDSPGVLVLDTGSRQEWAAALELLLRFLPMLKMIRQGPGGGDVLAGSKIKLSSDRVVWRVLTPDSRISEAPWSWEWHRLDD